MKDYVYSGNLDSRMLILYVDDLRNDAEFGILESITDIKIVAAPEYEILMREWSKGRVFCEAFELRWEWINGVYQTVLTGEVERDPFRLLPAVGTVERPEHPSTYFCWNETNPRLGRTLDYSCVSGEGDVQLSVYEYRDNRGRLVFWRYTNLTRVGDKS